MREDGQSVVSPCGPIPSKQQLDWHRLELTGFVHFTTNTFTDLEWGYGDESPTIFNPTAFDARQWASVAREAGMQGLILTCKHHDGFCLWPSRYTEHSVKNSPWKKGKGDVVREVVEACRTHGLKFGVYLSPWDRNHPAYGTQAYLDYYRNQLRELLTEYGPVFEVWFDGANGGDGFYGGARETRTIDRATYYGWPSIWRIVRELQPDAVIFSDVGPDIRWVGNESGVGAETTWYTLNTAGRYPGYGPPGYDHAEDLGMGHRDGQAWIPPEVDVSIRPGWFYHAAEDALVKSADQLLDIYYRSVGRGTNLLLNVPPDTRGLFAKTDVRSLMGLRQALDRLFADNLAKRAMVTATHTRVGSHPENVIDSDGDTYWAAPEGVTTATVELVFATPICFDHVILQEQIAFGQRIAGFTISIRTEQGWQPLACCTTMGHKRIVKTNLVTTSAVGVTITKADASPTLANIGLYLAT